MRGLDKGAGLTPTISADKTRLLFASTRCPSAARCVMRKRTTARSRRPRSQISSHGPRSQRRTNTCAPSLRRCLRPRRRTRTPGRKCLCSTWRRTVRSSSTS
uniref:Uncharacterized protein n=1 Tax=Anguilla anguilla TaxID=7936 RepID=A0A0E9R358_ANGAN